MSPRAGEILLDQIMPIIVAVIPRNVQVVGCEDHQELVQDALVMAAMMLQALEAAGKQPIPKSVAYYSIQRVKSGRRSYTSGRTDVYSPGTQLDGLAVLHSLDEPVTHEDGEDLSIGDMLADEVEDPSVTAGRDLDWQELETHLDRRENTIVQGLAEGRGTGELARTCGVSAPRICQITDNIAREITAVWGEDVLAQVGEEPRWKASLMARERVVV